MTATTPTKPASAQGAVAACPFCGGPAKMIYCMGGWQPGGYDPHGRRVVCASDDCSGVGKPFYGDDMEDRAIAWWNRRPLAAAPEPAASPAAGTSASVEAADWLRAFAKTQDKAVDRALLRTIATMLTSLPPPAPVGEAEPVGFMRAKDNDGGSFWCSRQKNGYYTEPVYATPSPAVGDVREAMARLENACERLAATRSQATYLAMIDNDKASDALLELDEARRQARAALATSPATPPGWPDPLNSPQAEAIRAGKIDDTEIRDLFDRMERELKLHRERAASSPATMEWVKGTYTTTDDDGGPREGIPRKLFAWRAGGYLIIQQDSPDGMFLLRGLSGGTGLVKPYLEAAKAAAQADYESRILSALSPAPAATSTSGDAVKERERLANLVEGLMAERVFADSAPARMAIAIAARNVRRGRALTPEEKFANLTDAIEEDDPDLAERLRAFATPRTLATPEAENDHD